MTYENKYKLAEKSGIMLPKEILKGENIVGIYEFFYYTNDSDKICFYIGKSTNIKGRLLDSSEGHIYRYLKYYIQNNKLECNYYVPSKIDEYINKGYKIKLEIKEIDYKDTSFSRAAHRLAFAELQEIVAYQTIGQCLDQLPEGVGKNEENFWNNNYKLNNK